MSDDPRPRQQDASRININEEHEIRYWTRALGVSEAELCKAVGMVGVSADKIRQYFAGNGDGKRSGQAH